MSKIISTKFQQNKNKWHGEKLNTEFQQDTYKRVRAKSVGTEFQLKT